MSYPGLAALLASLDPLVYTGGNRTGNLTTRKYNSSGQLQWSVDHGATVRGIAVETAQMIF